MDDFDAMGLAVDRPARMILMHPVTNQPLVDAQGEPGWIEVYSADSKIATARRLAIQQRRLDNVRGRGKLQAVTMEAEGTEVLVAITAAWRLLDMHGRELAIPCTPQNAQKLYTLPSTTWVREQVNEFAAERGNYAPPSSES